MDSLLEHSSTAVSVVLAASFLAAALWERVRPLLRFEGDDGPRWLGNIGLLCLGHVLAFGLVPLSTWLSATLAQNLGLGLLPWLQVPWLLAVLITVLALDLAGWCWHALMHHVGAFWRFHRVHHSDLEFDAALGFRFHPFEIIFVALGNALVVGLLGLPPAAVLLSALLTTAHNFFGHANAALPPRLEAWLRRLLITPDLHRVHHSAVAGDSMHNLSIVFSWWDRLFGTYRDARPMAPEGFGLDDERNGQRLGLPRLLWMPMQRPAAPS
jgi:sterol desaturase/sphingolipid hydroxylase (fatty acid hydroxylase superfamily)